MTVPTTIRHDTAARHHRKYHSRNPIQRLVLDRFFDAVAAELKPLAGGRALEFGCGEGFFLEKLRARGVVFADLLGIDLREAALQEARRRNPECRFACADLLAWAPPEPFDVVIASEVLEHLPRPEVFLERLVALSRQWLLLTVPWEPWFRLMNLARGRDLTRLGNHPEHVNRWGFGPFARFVAARVPIVRAYTIFPFTIVLARKPPSSPEPDRGAM